MDDFLRSIIDALKEFIQSVNKLSGAISEGQKKENNIFLESQQRYEDLIRNNHEQNEELAQLTRKHYEAIIRNNQRHSDRLFEKEQQTVEKLHAEQRRDHKKISWLTVLLGAVTFIGGMWWHISASRADARLREETTKMQVQVQQKAIETNLLKLKLQQRYHKESILQDKVNELRDKMKSYFALRDKLMVAMANMREIIDFGQEQCKDGQFAGDGPLEYREKRSKTIYNLVGVYYETANIFNNEIAQQIMHFVSLADKVKICEQNKTNSGDLKSLQENINIQIATTVSNLEKEKDSTEKELQNEEKGINMILNNESPKQ